MSTLCLFDKPTSITVRAGHDRYISARSLFLFLAEALDGCQLSDVDQITVYGEGDVTLNNQIVYGPRRIRRERVG
jgi:hypothetical protein